MKRKLLIPIALFMGCGALSAVLAQTVEGLDLEAIQKRGDAHLEDAQSLFDFATKSQAQHEGAAKEIISSGMETIRDLDVSGIKGPAGAIDLDEMVSGARTAMSSPKGAPLFLAFVSLSIPEESLSRIIAETGKAGGVVVFRGFTPGDPRRFIAGIQKVMTQDQASNVAIDPRLFRAFHVDRVPTYVAVSTSFDPCDQLDCVSEVPAFDRISGNISVEYALQTFVDANGPGARVARSALTNLGSGS